MLGDAYQPFHQVQCLIEKRRMKLSLFALFLVMAVACCKDDKGPLVCNVEDPISDLAWLKQKTVELSQGGFGKYAYITQSDSDNGIIFTMHNCCPVCDYVPTYYDCSGTKIEGSALKGLKNQKRIWLSEDNECVFID